MNLQNKSCMKVNPQQYSWYHHPYHHWNHLRLHAPKMRKGQNFKTNPPSFCTPYLSAEVSRALVELCWCFVTPLFPREGHRLSQKAFSLWCITPMVEKSPSAYQTTSQIMPQRDVTAFSHVNPSTTADRNPPLCSHRGNLFYTVTFSKR